MQKEHISDLILEIFRKYGRPLKLNEIAKAANIRSNTSDYETLKEALQSLSDTDVISKSARRRFSIKSYDDASALKGKLCIQHGKGLVITENEEFERISIKRRNLANALDGDIVLVKLQALVRDKKPRGEIVQVLERNRNPIVGTVEYDGNFFYLIPDEQKHYLDFLIPKQHLNGAKDGDKVSAEFLFWEDASKNPQAKVCKILGQKNAPDVEYDSIISEFDLPLTFPQHVIEDAKLHKKPRNLPSYKNRFDLREKIIITIDPEDAKDFDDALSLDFTDTEDVILGVHIADVSHYVPENSAIDIEARMRGTSVYLVDRVIPMLPENLSNDICSLKPNEVRLAYTVFMRINPLGDVVEYDINESVIKSKRRYHYDEVLSILKGETEDVNFELLNSLNNLTTTLRKRRFEKGGIDFETKEVKFKLDEKKVPVEVILKQSNAATQLVEECMLLANQTVASHVKEITTNLGLTNTAPYVYRVHEQPAEKQIKEALSFISSLGPKVQKQAVTSHHINKILAQFKGTPEETIVNGILIRSMAKAIYSHKNVGHFGLGFSDYTHFTSPIRRYPDLIIHRLLKEYSKKRITKDRQKFLHYLLKDVASHSSERERAAMEAERASIKLTHAVIAKSHTGEEFEGTVSGVTSFGIFVEMDNIYAEGLIKMKDMHDDYYIYDERNYRLIGRNTRRTFRIGKRVKVEIVRVNIQKREIDLQLLDEIE